MARRSMACRHRARWSRPTSICRRSAPRRRASPTRAPVMRPPTLAAGLIDFYFPDATLAMSQAAQGRVRMLASTPAKHVSVAPDLPTMQEAGVPGFDYSVVWAAWFPKGTPEPIVHKMHDWLVQIVERPDTKKFLFEAGAD